MREFIDGATAIVRGALASGCNFFAGYPITPASPILVQMMRELPKVGGIAIQGEDEIASIGLCIGAVSAGTRAMTATSGPGMSLYSENLGLAQIAEIPLVIVDVQRLGPATGGATTVGQGDVLFARWGTAGGYPFIVLAPSSIETCYTLTCEAFALAERFRCPVILLTDKELNTTLSSVAMPEAPETPPPPRERPVFDGQTLLRITGSTHDGKGYLTKDPARIEALNRHLWDKIMAHRHAMEYGEADLDPHARSLWIAFGVTARAMQAAAQQARERGAAISTLTLHTLWPVPENLLHRAAQGVERIVVAELNPGLYLREVAALFPNREVLSLARIDGQLIAPEQFLALL